MAVIAILVSAYFFFFRTKTVEVKVEKVQPEIEQLMSTDKQHFIPKKTYSTEATKERKDLLKFFIDTKLKSDGGILTNYLSDTTQTDVATGHELLSESSGLYLKNLALFDTQGRYDSFFKQTKTTFYDEVQFSYRVNEDKKKYSVNASVDDTRIIRSLIEASAKFNTDEYEAELDTLAKNFMATSMEDHVLIDFYDVKTKQKSSDTSLFYIDLLTLGYLYKKYDISSDYLQYHYNLIDQGYLSDTFPLYETKFNHETGKYENNCTINIIESLLTILHLSEVGLEKPASIDFVKEQVKRGTLFNSFDLTGTPIDKNQSAASYALSALIGVATGDQELYDMSITVLNNFQITDPKSPLYGGFGDEKTRQVYSYNNLMALLAYDF